MGNGMSTFSWLKIDKSAVFRKGRTSCIQQSLAYSVQCLASRKLVPGFLVKNLEFSYPNLRGGGFQIRTTILNLRCKYLF